MRGRHDRAARRRRSVRVGMDALDMAEPLSAARHVRDPRDLDGFLCSGLVREINRLPAWDKLLLRLRYGLDGGVEHTLSEIAELYSLSPQRVQQRLCRIQNFLYGASRRRWLQSHGLRPGPGLRSTAPRAWGLATAHQAAESGIRCRACGQSRAEVSRAKKAAVRAATWKDLATQQRVAHCAHDAYGRHNWSGGVSASARRAGRR